MKPGDEVVCIKDYSERWYQHNRCFRVTTPTVGQRYTVRDICSVASTPSILLGEIRNPTVRFNRDGHRGEASFVMSHFRVIGKEQHALVEKFTTGASPDSEQWDNRRWVPVEIARRHSPV